MKIADMFDFEANANAGKYSYEVRIINLKEGKEEVFIETRTLQDLLLFILEFYEGGNDAII